MAIKANSPLRVLFLSAEVEPFAKVGGLGDYAGSLPYAISTLKTQNGAPVDIRVALPFHDQINKHISSPEKIASINVEKKDGFAKGSVYQFIHKNIIYYLIKRSGNASGYKNVYNASQTADAQKYIFYSLACLELIKQIDWMPDILHANDWHTAIAVYQLAHKKRADHFYESGRSLFTIHNLPFLGEGSQSTLREFNLKPLKTTLLPDWAKFLPSPMGLDKADEIVAVSPTYAEELKQEEFSNGLSNFFKANTEKTTGILNGIDTELWNPENDNLIDRNYSIKDIGIRRANKLIMLRQFGMEDQIDQPLIIMISRLTHQKGIDLLLQGFPYLENEEWSAIILGSGQPELEQGLLMLQAQFSNRFKVVLGYDNHLAHRLYASGDILLMPSQYEPCGLSQMIAMRYGCIPVARSVGGLKDSIKTFPESMQTGYLFDKATREDFVKCLQKAITDFKASEKWLRIQKNAMAQDFTWSNSAKKYLDLYTSMLSVCQ